MTKPMTTKASEQKILSMYHIYVSLYGPVAKNSATITLASRGLEEPAHASRGLEELFLQLCTVFGSGRK